MPTQAALKKQEQIESVIKLVRAGRTPAQAASAVGVSLRTVQRWLSDPNIKARLQGLEAEHAAIVKSDPVVLSVTEVRHQVEQILNYRETQYEFALEMGKVVRKSTAILLTALQRLEQNPDELSVRMIPQLMRAVTDASEKVASAWSRATGLDHLLEVVGDEPQTDSQGQETA